MGELLLIVIVIILAAKGDYSFFWIIGGMFVLCLIGALFGKGNEKKVPRERPGARIDIPHYCDADEDVCSVCGQRFSRNLMSCPHCNVRFNTIKTDDRAFIEEEDEMEDWDEEDGW